MERVRGVEVSLDVVETGPVADFWCELLGYRAEGDHDAEWVRLDPPDGLATTNLPTISLQRVAEPARGRSRMRLDVYVDDPEAWVGRALELGADRLELHDDEDDWYCLMADPAGNEFCICREPDDD